ncbi:DNA polymerase III subunit chi [Zavarzinia sp. CC-PAN008]
MADVAFYHLTARPLEEALPRLLERVLASGLRAVVLAGSPERVDWLDSLLWTYERESFLPHGRAPDPHAALQPVWLTDRLENPNGATVLLLVDGAVAARFDGYDRVLDLFDGNDDAAVAAARDRYRAARAAGHTLTYWKQKPAGGWEKA